MYKLLLALALVALIATVAVEAQFYYGGVPSWGGYTWGGVSPVYSGWGGYAAVPGYVYRK